MTWNNDMTAAPRDGTVIIAGSFNVPWADSHLEGRIYRVWWQDEFDAFIEGCRQMTMAAGYTIDGAQSKLHSPEIPPFLSHWQPYETPPQEPDNAE